MNYKGYSGSVFYDDEAEIFSGSVIGIKDVITFQGLSVEEIKQSFKDSIDDYLDFCKERGENPSKSYSGKFNLRISADLHAKLDATAKINRQSLNAFVAKTLSTV